MGGFVVRRSKEVDSGYLNFMSGCDSVGNTDTSLEMKVGNSYFIVKLGEEQNGTHISAPIYSEKYKSSLHNLLV